MRYQAAGGRRKLAGEMTEGKSGRFFDLVFTDLDKRGFGPETPLLLLVGGCDWRSLAIRAAQAPLRLDRQPSYWSHAALILDWRSRDPRKVLGAEATFTPEREERRVPERNGVTSFRLARYCDEEAYPHLAVAAFRSLPKKGKGKAANGGGVPEAETARPAVDLAEIRAAALSPNRDKLRYPLWQQLGAWTPYLHDPQVAPNPLSASVPLPAASYCEYAFEAGGVDLTPSASGPQSCPELFWATVLFWADNLERAGIETLIYQRKGKSSAFSRKALSPELKLGE